MKKRLIAWVLVLLTMLTISVPAFAGNQDEHSAIIERVLFGDGEYKKTLQAAGQKKKKQKLEDLENAVALCLDQFNNTDQGLLDSLNKHGVHGIPKSIDAFSFPGNSMSHREQTHLGWKHNYEKSDNFDWPQIWKTRKNILLQTVNKVFGFQWLAGEWSIFGKTIQLGYDDQCDAFAAFLYYLHVLGDYKEYNPSQRDSLTGKVIPLVTDDKENFFSELERVLPILLEDSVGTKSYQGFIHDIKKMKDDVKKMDNIDYAELADTLLEKLERNVPNLLKNEPFFEDVFYK